MSFLSKNECKSALSAAKQKLLDDDDIPSKNRQSDKYSHDSENDKARTSKSKKKNKEKKHKKKKSKKRHRSPSSESSSSSDERDAWVEKIVNTPETKEKTKEKTRDDWMNMTGAFSTYTRKDLKPDEPKEKKVKGQIDAYNPSECSRELNPYWKNGGTGLPSESSLKYKQDSYSSRSNYSDRDSSSTSSSQFIKPIYENETGREKRDRHSRDNVHSSSRFRRPNYEDEDRRDRQGKLNTRHREPERNWRKNTESSQRSDREISPPPRIRDSREDRQSNPIESCKRRSQSPQETVAEIQTKCDYLTDQEMNTLGAKIVKAEILGNTKLIADLNAKLEAARQYKKLHPEGPPQDAVMLTVTDAKGNTRPLSRPQQVGDPRSKGGKKKATTHLDGERMKFFADDDKHSLKEMFQREKFGDADDDEKEFSEIISKHTNPNDDLEDIFAEKISKNKSDAGREQKNLHKAISQHQSTERSLQSCQFCVDSEKMIKHMIVSLGSKAYVALPTQKSLTEGHCFISTVGHVSCSTMIDEDVWTEILSYRRALTSMCNSRDEDVVFFETAVYFHKHPHVVIHCVPLPRDVGDTAPIYFKKALLECEAEWSNNKKVVDLRGKDIRRGVPKGLPYFWIDFGMDPGFAHVIEDQQLFPNNFAQEIIGGMLDLHHSLWRKPQRENFEAQRKKVLQFTTEWKKFDPIESS